MSSGSPSATPPFKTSARNPLPLHHSLHYSFICGKGYSPPSGGRIAFCLQSKESPAFPPGIPQLAHISKLGLNSKIKKFSDFFICGKGYSPPSGERIAFCLQSNHRAQSAGAQCAPLRARRHNAQFLFPQHCRGAHRAPVIGIFAKFRICSFTVQSKESPAFPPGIPYTHLGLYTHSGLITWQTPGRWPCRSPGSQPSRRRRYPRQRSGWR